MNTLHRQDLPIRGYWRVSDTEDTRRFRTLGKFRSRLAAEQYVVALASVTTRINNALGRTPNVYYLTNPQGRLEPIRAPANNSDQYTEELTIGDWYGKTKQGIKGVCD